MFEVNKKKENQNGDVIWYISYFDVTHLNALYPK